MNFSEHKGISKTLPPTSKTSSYPRTEIKEDGIYRFLVTYTDNNVLPKVEFLGSVDD